MAEYIERAAVEKMAEQRLIDANKILYHQAWESGSMEPANEGVALMSEVQAMPTIDPEALPIVRQLREELEQVRRERDAAQSLLAERIGVRGAEPITTAFGLPIDRLRELAEADREGKIPKYTIGDTIYDRFGDAWEVTAVERRLLAGEPKWIYRCGHIGTNDYCALWEFEVLTRAEAEAVLRREQNDRN